MKLKNIFKKDTSKAITSVESLDKKQLEKVIGGTKTTTTTPPVQEGKKGLNAVNVKLA